MSASSRISNRFTSPIPARPRRLSGAACARQNHRSAHCLRYHTASTAPRSALSTLKANRAVEQRSSRPSALSPASYITSRASHLESRSSVSSTAAQLMTSYRSTSSGDTAWSSTSYRPTGASVATTARSAPPLAYCQPPSRSRRHQPYRNGGATSIATRRDRTATCSSRSCTATTSSSGGRGCPRRT